MNSYTVQFLIQDDRTLRFTPSTTGYCITKSNKLKPGIFSEPADDIDGGSTQAPSEAADPGYQTDDEEPNEEYEDDYEMVADDDYELAAGTTRGSLNILIK